VGGQCVELYPDKPIYDIPAVPICTGQELTDNLLKQIEPFSPTFHLGQEVSVVERREDGRFFVETSLGTRFITKTIFIAAGVGSFQPRTLKVEGIDKFEGKQLFYRVKDPSRFHGRNLVVVGGGDSALDWTLDLVGKAESVVMIHRRDGFRAAPASVAKMRELCEQMEMQFMVGQIGGYEEKDGVLTEIKVTGADGVTRRMPSTTSSCSSVCRRSSARSPNGAWTSSASRSRWTPRSSRRTSRASSRLATSTPIRARRS
jgi:thioredoxin reductase (NADPH)